MKVRRITTLGTVGALLAGLALTTPAQAIVSWIPSPTMSQLNVVEDSGIKQQDRREYNTAGQKLTDSETQHQQAWIRMDTRMVIVRYDCMLHQANVASPTLSNCQNKQVQFVIDLGNMPSGRVVTSIDTNPVSGSMQYITKETDATGVADIMLHFSDVDGSNTLLEDDGFSVHVTNYDASAPSAAACTDTTCSSDMAISWHPAGYFPQIHMLNQDLRPANPNCGGLNWALDETWGWSVFKKDWLGENACVYTKSYPAGATLTMPFQATDIWGEPIADSPIDLIHPAQYCNGGGSVACTWATTEDHKYTDSDGYATFSIRNTNTPAQVCANVGLNGEDELLPLIQQRRTNCAMGADFYASMNQSPESYDLFWPQIVNSMGIPAASLKTTMVMRGADTPGTVVAAGSTVSSTDTPMTVDVDGSSNTDLIKLTIEKPLVAAGTRYEYFANTNPDLSCFSPVYKSGKINSWRKVSPTCQLKQNLYAPDVTITATNGGVALRICPDLQNPTQCHGEGRLYGGEVYDASQMSSSVTFGLQYASTVVLGATRRGLTTWTIKVGTQTYSVSQNFETASLTSDAGIATVRDAAATVSSAIGKVGTATSLTFSAVDRFGNPFSRIPMHLTTNAGGEFVPGQVGFTYNLDGSIDTVTPDADGLVTVQVQAPSGGTLSGTQIVTATISSPDGKTTQIGNSAIDAFPVSVAASSPTASSTVRWGDVVRLTAPAVAGVVKSGKKLTVSPGTWQAFPAPTVAIAWFACTVKSTAATATGSGCRAIAGQTRSTLAITKAMIRAQKKRYLRARITVTSGAWSPVVVFSPSTSTYLK